MFIFLNVQLILLSGISLYAYATKRLKEIDFNTAYLLFQVEVRVI